MKQKSGGGLPILISKDNRPGGKESLLESSAGDAYYNNPNVSLNLFPTFRIEMKLLIRALYRELRLNTLLISSLNTSWVENCHSIVKRRDYLAHASLG